MSVLGEWLARVGASFDDAWFATSEPSDDHGTIRGQASDPAIALLQVQLDDGRVSRVHLDLATPMRRRDLDDELGPGETMYAADATYATVVWRRGDVTVAADVDHGDVLRRVSLSRTST